MPKDDGLQDVLNSFKGGDAESLVFYSGSVLLQYSDSLHAYYTEKDGANVLVPGVTTVVGMIDKSGPLTQWAANETVNYIRRKLAKLARPIPNRPGVVWGKHRLQYHIETTKELDKILNEARFNYRSISKIATDIGHEAHGYLENFIKYAINPTQTIIGKEIRVGDKARNCVEAALGWFAKHKFRPMFSERKIYSRKFNYAGTLDWIGEITGCGDHKCCPFTGTVKALGDFKSSKNLYDEYRAQTAAYQAAWEEEFPDQKLDIRVLMRLDKEGDGIETMVMTPDEFDADLDGFLGALAVYNWMTSLELNRKLEKQAAKAEKKAAKEAEKAAEKAARAALKAAAKASKPIQERKRRKTVIKALDPIPIEEKAA